jgi:hypothetical protein
LHRSSDWTRLGSRGTDAREQFENLAGIRRHARHNLIERVELSSVSDGGGILHVVFTNGDTSAPYFQSFEVMQGFVRRWRNAHGATLMVNGIARGAVSSEEPIGYPPYSKQVPN